MALKDTWRDIQDEIDEASGEYVNMVARAVIDLEENGAGINSEEVKAIVKDALTEAKESGEFDGEDGKPYAYMLTTDEKGNLYCEYADTDAPPSFLYDEESGNLYYETENSTRYKVLDVNVIVDKVLGQMSGGVSTYSVRAVDNEIDTQDLIVSDSTTGKTILNMSFVRNSNDTATIMTVRNTKGDSVEILIKDGAIKSVNGLLPDENGNVQINATIEAPTPAESVEWLEKYGDHNKQYVVDGYLYAYMQKIIPAHKEPLFTNYFDINNVLLNEYVRYFEGSGGVTVTKDNFEELGAVNPDGIFQMVNAIPFTYEDLSSQHIIRVANLGYGIKANPNFIQPWIGNAHASAVTGVRVGHINGVVEEAGGVQQIPIPIGMVLENYPSEGNWLEKNSLKSMTGIKLNLKDRTTALTKEDLQNRNIIITFDEEIKYEDVPERIDYLWVKGQKYGDDYSEEIKDLTERMENLESKGEVSSIINPFIKSINHRGYRKNGASENTLQAYKDSKKVGFDYVECDVQFTSDNIPVLQHDNIGSVTYSELIAQKPNLATFEDFILLCRNLGLHPYIEIKDATLSESRAELLYDICKSYGMHKNCTWISFWDSSLSAINAIDATARLGYVVGAEAIGTYQNTVLELKTNDNEVFVNAEANKVDDNMVVFCKSNNISLEVWTVNDISGAEKLSPYVSGFSSDTLVIGAELLKKNLK